MDEVIVKPKRSTLALISLILGVLYLVYIVWYFSQGIAKSTSDAEAIGKSIATALVLPHMVCVLIAVLFNALGFFMRNRAFILVGAIMYGVSIFMFFMYFMFVIVQMILSFIAFARMPKQNYPK